MTPKRPASPKWTIYLCDGDCTPPKPWHCWDGKEGYCGKKHKTPKAAKEHAALLNREGV